MLKNKLQPYDQNIFKDNLVNVTSNLYEHMHNPDPTQTALI